MAQSGEKPGQSKSTGVLRAAGAMGAATFLSRITGLVREQVIAVLFGAGNATDAYNVAFRIPNLLRDLFAEGAMSASLVPTFTQERVLHGDRRAWRVAGLVFRVLFVIVAGLTLLGMLFAPQIVSLYAGAYKAVPGKYELTVLMTRIIFPFFPVVSLAAAFMGILNACGVFFWPAFASAIFNLVSVAVGIAGAWFFRDTHPILGMAVGVVAGGTAQALCQLPSLRRQGYRFPKREASDPVWNRDPALKRMLWMMIPGTIGLAATQVNLLVNTMLATSQGPGSVSYLSFAFRLMQFPIGIFGVSLASATLPRISRLWVERDLDGVSRTLTQSLKQVFAINLPCAVGLAALGTPIIRMIFQYGRFDAAATEATALALAMYSVGLVAYSGVKVMVPACYAFGNTRLPVISSFLSVAVTIILNLIMVSRFGFWGLALGTSLASIFNLGFLFFAVRMLLRQAGGELKLAPLVRAFFQYVPVAAAMGAVCYFSHRGLELWVPDTFVGISAGKLALASVRLVKLGVVIGEGGLVFVGLGMLFKLDAVLEVADLFRRKLKKKLR